MLPAAAFIGPGFLLGSIPFGMLLTRAAGLGDIRRIGSGNIGATNVLRTGHKGLAAATLLLDGGKGAVAVLMARHFGTDWGFAAALWAGLGAVLGHMFPPWLLFRGGKGVATGFGVLLAAAWPVGLVAGAIWLVVAKTMRISSVAALTSFTLAPILAVLLEPDPARQGVALMALAITLLIYFRHHTNIRRLLAGTEPRIGH